MTDSKDVCTCWVDPFRLDPVCLQHNRPIALIAQALARAKNGDEYDRSSVGYARVLRNEVAWAVPVVQDFIDMTIEHGGAEWKRAYVEVGAFRGALQGLVESIASIEAQPNLFDDDRAKGVLQGLRMAQEMFDYAADGAVEKILEQNDADARG